MRLLLSTCLLFLPLWLSAQEITFEASAEPRTVVEGSYFKLNFTLKNSDSGKLSPPDLSAFQVVGKETSPSFSFGLFGISKSIVYSFYLRPKSLGTFTIGPASVVVDGKTYRSNTVSIKVVKPGAPGTPGALLEKIKAGKGIFLAAEVSHPEAYLGQQIIVDYKLYTAVGLDRYNIVSESDYAGFYAQAIQRFDSSVKIEELQGEQYRTKVLQRVALFPQKTGLLTIGPMEMSVSISLQSGRRAIRQTIASEQLDITVRDLPDFRQPESFTGAIGTYKFESFFRNNQLTTDDAMIIGLSLRGSGDVKQIDAPILDLGPDFEVYEPEISESVYQEAGMVAGTKTFQFMVLPKVPGIYTYNPEISYYDIDSMRYVTLRDDPVNIRVSKGQLPLASETESLVEEVLEPELAGPKAADKLRRSDRAFFGSWIFILLSVIPLLLGLGTWLFKQKLIKDALIDPSIKKKKLARAVAEKRLVQAKQLLETRQEKAFYDEIVHAVWTYLGDRLDIPPAALSKQNIADKLEGAGLDPAFGAKIVGLLETCEMALFAGFNQEEKMPEVYESSVQLISNLEDVIHAQETEESP